MGLPLISADSASLVSQQSGGCAGLAASKLQHGFRGGHDEWRAAHLQPDAHEEGFPAHERAEEASA